MKRESIYLGDATALDAKHAEPCFLSSQDFGHGVLMLGTSQVGKTNLVQNMVGEMVDRQLSLTSIDVEGGTHSYCLKKAVSRYSIREFSERCVVIDFARGSRWHLPLNFLADDPDFDRFTIIEELVGVLTGTWSASNWEIAVRQTGQIRSAAHLLADHGLSLAEFNQLITDKDFSAVLAERSQSRYGRYFHEHYRAPLSEYVFRQWSEAASNKIAPLVFSPFLGPCLEAPSCVNLAKWMDEGKQVFIHLNEPDLGEQLKLIGSLLITKYARDSGRRAEHPTPHLLICDEVQEFASPSLSKILARRQKRGLGVLLSFQLIEGQLDETMFESILGLTRTRLSFPLGNRDHARRMVRELFDLTGDRRTKPHHDPVPAQRGLDGMIELGRPAELGYWSISEELEHFARELQQAAIGEAVIQRVHEGWTAWLKTPRRPDPPDVPQSKIDEYVAASCERHLASDADIAHERKRKTGYLAGIEEAVRKKAHARAMASAAKRRGRS